MCNVFLSFHEISSIVFFGAPEAFYDVVKKMPGTYWLWIDCRAKRSLIAFQVFALLSFSESKPIRPVEASSFSLSLQLPPFVLFSNKHLKQTAQKISSVFSSYFSAVILLLIS